MLLQRGQRCRIAFGSEQRREERPPRLAEQFAGIAEAVVERGTLFLLDTRAAVQPFGNTLPRPRLRGFGSTPMRGSRASTRATICSTASSNAGSACEI